VIAKITNSKMTKISKDIQIDIKGLRTQAIIGVYEEEKNNKQELLIDVNIIFDGANAMLSDDLKDTVDYFEISKEIKDKVENSSFELLEKLLDFVLKIIMKNDLVKEAQVTIHKPEALKNFGAIVSVTSNAKK
jgi:FolB domain-containing protein